MMEHYHFNPDDTEAIRISDSPQRSPQITHNPSSPLRSIHKLQMDSLHSQPDMGLRTTDFFEDSSEEAIHDPDEGIAPDADFVRRRASASKKRHTASTTDAFVTQCEPRACGALEPDLQGYHRLSPDEGNGDRQNILVETASSSFRGSVDELLPGGQHSSPPPPLRTARIASDLTPRSFEQSQRSDIRNLSVPTTKVEQTLGAYAIAHEITLNALMRDEEALSKTLDTFALAPLSAEGRQSLLPHALDPRSPRKGTSSTPTTATTKKSVQVVPPTIDTSAPRKSIPDDIVRTPYPFPPDSVHYQAFSNESVQSVGGKNTPPSTETTLTVSIARSNTKKQAHVTTLTIPASIDFTAVRLSSVGAKERHFKALDFDDAKFFYNLRRCYRELSGPARYFSARSLSRVVVSGPSLTVADVRHNWSGPRAMAGGGTRDTFNEEQIMQHYRKPALGRSRYAFVHWAHQLVNVTPASSSAPVVDWQGDESSDRSSGGEQPKGLMFILSWSVRRILTALLLVLAASIAATLLWILLGQNTTDARLPQGGFRNAGDRVASGMLIGICVLLLGLSSIAGWLGISWTII